MSKDKSDVDSPVRLDKWLWAARLYKTRAIAKQAVESGKVHCAGQRVKPGRDVTIGMHLQVRQGWDDRELVVLGLSEHRRGAPEALLLYEETAESIEKREKLGEQRRMHALLEQPIAKPDKKDRRLRQQMKHRAE
ncbi:MAG: S4 domain-containing protein [Gammaproteobacteria bacterium]